MTESDFIRLILAKNAAFVDLSIITDGLNKSLLSSLQPKLTHYFF